MLKLGVATVIFTCIINSVNAQFVKVQNQHFTVKNKPYYYIGTNYWYGSLLAAMADSAKGKERIRRELDFLKQQGVTNLRILAGSEGQGIINGIERVKPALQPEHNIFNPEVIRGLDYLLYEMGKRQMYAVVYLSNNWEWSGGFLQYLNWNGQLDDDTLKAKPTWETQRDITSKFYTCEPCLQDYKKQLHYILNHINTYTKKPYINDAAIMAWELANEPRPMRPAAIDAYKAWIKDITQTIKATDKNHLVTLGTEGYIGTEDSDQLYEEIHAAAQVDYLTIHIWPKNWNWFSDTSIVKGMPTVVENTHNFINRNLAVAAKLKKPLVIEEFGMPRDAQSFDPASTTTSRDSYYTLMFNELLNSKQSNRQIAGCNFWAFGGIARPIKGQIFWKEGDDYMGDPPMEEQGLNTVFDSDKTTWKLIKKYSDLLKK